MNMQEARPGSVSEDWSVIFQSVSPKQKKEIVKRIVEIFELEKKDVENALSGMPLILVDNLSFSLAARIKNFFQKLGAVVETTNHDMIKKNCFQIVWPEAPDLAYFLKEERTKEPTKEPKPGNIRTQTESKPETQKPVEPVSMPVSESNKEIAPPPNPLGRILGDDKKEDSQTEAKESDWEKRAKALSDRLQMIQDDKKKTDGSVMKEGEKTKGGFFGKPKSVSGESSQEDIFRLREELAQAHKSNVALQSTCDDFRSKAEVFEKRIREIEADLVMKTQALELMSKGKDDILKVNESNQAREAATKALEAALAKKDEENALFQVRLQEYAMKASEIEKDSRESQQILEAAKNELAASQRREQEMAEKTKAAEHSLQEIQQRFEEIQNEMNRLRSREQELSTKATGLEATLQEKEKAVEEMRQRVSDMQNRETELITKAADLEKQLSAKEKATGEMQNQVLELQACEKDSAVRIAAMEQNLLQKEEGLKARDAALEDLEKKVMELGAKIQEAEIIRQEHAVLSQERATIREKYDSKLAEQEVRIAKLEDEHRRYRSRADRRNAAAIRELGEWTRNVDFLRQGLQKLTAFLGNQSAEPEPEKKNSIRSIFKRPSDQNGSAPQS